MGGKWHLDGTPSDKVWGFDEHCLYGSLCEAAKDNRDWTARYAGPWWPATWPSRNVLPKRDGRGNPYAIWHPMIIRDGNFIETGVWENTVLMVGGDNPSLAVPPWYSVRLPSRAA